MIRNGLTFIGDDAAALAEFNAMRATVGLLPVTHTGELLRPSPEPDAAFADQAQPNDAAFPNPLLETPIQTRHKVFQK